MMATNCLEYCSTVTNVCILHYWFDINPTIGTCTILFMMLK